VFGHECESGLASTEDVCDFQAEVRDLHTSLSTLKYFSIGYRLPNRGGRDSLSTEVGAYAP
jgi:hypothetical protein